MYAVDAKSPTHGTSRARRRADRTIASAHPWSSVWGAGSTRRLGYGNHKFREDLSGGNPKSLRSRRATCRRRQWKAQRILRRRALWFSFTAKPARLLDFQPSIAGKSSGWRCRSHFSDPILSSSGRLKTVRTPLDNATRRRSRNRLNTQLTWTGVSPTASAMCCWRNGKG